MLSVPLWLAGQAVMTPADRYDGLFQIYAEWSKTELRRFIPRVSPLDWRLLKAIALTESAMDPDAQSPAGAQGLCQFMPGTFEEWAEKRSPTRRLSPFNPEHSIFLQAEYVEWLLTRPALAKDWPRVLGAYNWGVGNLTRTLERYGEQWGTHLPRETSDYIRRVLTRYDELQEVGRS